jgi:hypothetical protein
MGKRLLLGMLKGLVIGGAIGALLTFVVGAPVITGWVSYLLYAAVAAIAGVLSGRAPWKPGAWIAAVLKGVFGLVVGAGLYALGSRFLPELAVAPGVANGVRLASQPLVFAPLVALLYSTFVELDDGGEQTEEEQTSGVRVGKLSVDDIDVGEDEEAEKPAAKSAKKN